jgi:hypothetical protein
MWLYVYSVVTCGAHMKEKQIHGKRSTSRVVAKVTKCSSEYPKERKPATSKPRREDNRKIHP